MSAMFRNLLGILAVLSVGTFQVLGVPTGYYCPCTGENTVEAGCETVVCHPEAPHAEGCATDAERDAGSRDDHHGESSEPAPCGQSHGEVRESLEMAGAAQAAVLPTVVFYVLSPAFPWPEVPASDAGRASPELPPDGSPPTPLLVARTMVMLV